MRFLETLFRHKILAVLPVIIGLAVAGGYEVVQPRSFTSTTNLWINTTIPGQSSSATQYVDPSTTQQLVVQELLKSRSFDVSVGHSGGLAAYLTGHPNAEATGLAAIPGLHSLFSSSQGSLDDQLAVDIPLDVTVAPTGPQVVAITVQGPSPGVAAGTARALVSEYASEVVKAQTASDQVAVTYYGQQVAQGQATLQSAEQALIAYQDQHPQLAANALDPTATELSQAVDNARTSYQSLLSQYEQANLSLTNEGNNTGFRVLDAAAANGSPVSISKKVLGASIGGLLVGLLVSVLMLSALTAADRTARRALDLKRVLGLDVAASVGRVPKGTNPA
jgi:uncharacterized protein involved in exopolysaccharide biosynthesis